MTVNIFSLLDGKKTIPYLILLSVWNVSILLAFSSVFFMDRHPKIFQLFLLIFLISCGIWTIGNLLIKKYKIIGTIEIGKDLIIVNNKEATSYYVNKIENLVLRYGGIKGDSYGAYAGLLRINDGTDNFVSFKFGGKPFKYYFLISDKNFIGKLYNTFKLWEEKSIGFKITIAGKGDVTRKVLDRSEIT